MFFEMKTIGQRVRTGQWAKKEQSVDDMPAPEKSRLIGFDILKPRPYFISQLQHVYGLFVSGSAKGSRCHCFEPQKR